jgi:hypothetical protein
MKTIFVSWQSLVCTYAVISQAQHMQKSAFYFIQYNWLWFVVCLGLFTLADPSRCCPIL